MITADGRTYVGEVITKGLGGATPSTSYGYLEIGTGSASESVSDTGVATPLAAGGRVALSAGFPKIVAGAGGPELHFQATFAAGSFTTGTAITEAAVRELVGGGKCFGRELLDASKNPTADEPLTITLKYPIVAGT